MRGDFLWWTRFCDGLGGIAHFIGLICICMCICICHRLIEGKILYHIERLWDEQEVFEGWLLLTRFIFHFSRTKYPQFMTQKRHNIFWFELQFVCQYNHKTCEYLRSIILRISNLSLRFLHASAPRRLQREVTSRMKPTWKSAWELSFLVTLVTMWRSYYLQARRHWIGQESRNRLGQNIFYTFRLKSV